MRGCLRGDRCTDIVFVPSPILEYVQQLYRLRGATIEQHYPQSLRLVADSVAESGDGSVFVGGQNPPSDVQSRAVVVRVQLPAKTVREYSIVVQGERQASMDASRRDVVLRRWLRTRWDNATRVVDSRRVAAPRIAALEFKGYGVAKCPSVRNSHCIAAQKFPAR